ncbi:hypothetical protein [Kitasatospora camelliae]|uniref:Excreted virulence factor EspC (Type VII ESX diderm) n=1 Tax=Kitasatospora camelliae TaxID=3156397 RepID=A0AAU8JRF9_9ACTN
MADREPRQVAGQARAAHDGSHAKPGAHPDEYPNTTQLPPERKLEGTAPTPPPVPGAKPAGGQTAVSTPSLDVFARNVESLLAPVKEAMDKLRQTRVAPGAFYHADEIRGRTVGPNGDGGLKDQMVKALGDVYSGLTAVSRGVAELSRTYTGAEEANRIKGTDLQKSLDGARGDFAAMLKDSGGSPGAAGGGTPPPAA